MGATHLPKTARARRGARQDREMPSLTAVPGHCC